MNKKSNPLIQKIGIVLFLLFCSGFSLMAQRTITGKISDGISPIPGVNVLVKGTTTGTVTDGDGNFSLSVKEADPILSISAIGFASQEIVVGTQSVIDVSLKEDVATLQELIVTGYSSQRKKDITGAVTVVNTKDYSNFLD